MASQSYTTTDSYNNTSSNPITTTISYTATYDPATDSTAVEISSVKTAFWSRASYSASWYCSISVAADDTDYSAKTIACYQGSSSSARKTTTATPVVTKLIVQHSGAAGDKKIRIKGTTRLNYIYSASATTLTSKSFTPAAAQTITVATDQPAVKHTNKMFVDRDHVLTSPDYRSSSSHNIMGITIPYSTRYDPITNQTTVNFTKDATLNHTQNGYKLVGSVSITIAPVDNPDLAPVQVTLNVPSETTSSAQTIGKTTLSGFSPSSVVIQHASTDDGPREITIKLVPAVKFYYSSSSYWTFDNDYSNTFISGIAGASFVDPVNNIVYIHNGTEYIGYKAYIDNGHCWESCIPHAYSGASWDPCCISSSTNG